MSYRAQSVYLLLCVCTKGGEPVVIESHAPEATCPNCGRFLVIEGWGQPASAETAKDAAEERAKAGN